MMEYYGVGLGKVDHAEQGNPGRGGALTGSRFHSELTWEAPKWGTMIYVLIYIKNKTKHQDALWGGEYE